MEVSMDDATDNGKIAVDDEHGANSTQSALGHLLPKLATQGYLIRTDRTIKSKSPKRKSGRDLLWTVTDNGREWAHEFLAQQSPRKRTIKRVA